MVFILLVQKGAAFTRKDTAACGKTPLGTMVPHYQERDKSNMADTRIFQKILQTGSHFEILCECWLFGKGMLCSDKLVGIMSLVKKNYVLQIRQASNFIILGA